MLKKMMIHGLIAAAVIGGAAAVYASGRGNGDGMDNAAPAMRADTGNPQSANNGYIADGDGYTKRNRYFWQEREDDDERKHDRYGEGSEHHRKHGKRDDD